MRFEWNLKFNSGKKVGSVIENVPESVLALPHIFGHITTSLKRILEKGNPKH